MPFTLNGCGTKYYGRRDIGNDGSYITTLWITLIWIPLLPLRTYRVLPTGKGFNAIVFANSEFLSRKVPLNWVQIRNVYLVALPFFAVLLYFAYGDVRKEHKSLAVPSLANSEPNIANPSDSCGAHIKLDVSGMTKLGIKDKMTAIVNGVELTESDKKAMDQPDQEAFEGYSLGFLTWQKPLTDMKASLEKSFADIESKARQDSNDHTQAYAEAVDSFVSKERSLITEGFTAGRKDARLSPCPY